MTQAHLSMRWIILPLFNNLFFSHSIMRKIIITITVIALLLSVVSTGLLVFMQPTITPLETLTISAE